MRAYIYPAEKRRRTDSIDQIPCTDSNNKLFLRSRRKYVQNFSMNGYFRLLPGRAGFVARGHRGLYHLVTFPLSNKDAVNGATMHPIDDD
jgi:hypothetical protein